MLLSRCVSVFVPVCAPVRMTQKVKKKMYRLGGNPLKDQSDLFGTKSQVPEHTAGSDAWSFAIFFVLRL